MSFRNKAASQLREEVVIAEKPVEIKKVQKDKVLSMKP